MIKIELLERCEKQKRLNALSSEGISNKQVSRSANFQASRKYPINHMPGIAFQFKRIGLFHPIDDLPGLGPTISRWKALQPT
jgi:hypothetical protein